MTTELLNIEFEHLTISIKGEMPDVKLSLFNNSPQMRFKVTGPEAKVEFFDVVNNQIQDFNDQPIPPLFLENGIYQVAIVPKGDNICTFHHEYDAFQKAFSDVPNTNILMGNLHFRNEIGLTDLVFQLNGRPYATVTIEVFPKKLDYQKDYLALIEEVNEEIYNLAYSFIKRTYVTASLKQYKDPTLSEFYRILEQHVEEYFKAIEQIERFPHHQLITTHELVRGEKLRKQDSFGRSYLRKNAGVFVETTNGIELAGKKVMPTKGYLSKKIQTYDTHENRYVKWTMQRIISRLNSLSEKLQKIIKNNENSIYHITLERINTWKVMLNKLLNKPFWREIGKIDRSVYSLVMQMGIGYREVFEIYTILSQSLILHGEFYKMSLKDVATLYEYWSFLKVGQILAGKCKVISQDIVQIKSDGVYVNLSADHAATRIFEHPQTGEKIELKYQYHSGRNSQTVDQRPDTMLFISKAGKDYAFQYILDAKYRVDLEGKVGPMNGDINAMHRYRDAIVAEQMNIYERLTFGAYVLFPWINEEEYRNHALFVSINKVNIGGLPFLPNNTKFVEELIDNLLNKSGIQLQSEGILPKGTVNYVKDYEGDVLIVNAPLTEDFILVPYQWVDAHLKTLKYIAFVNNSCVHTVASITYFEKDEDSFKIYFHDSQNMILEDDIHFIEEYLIVSRNALQHANTYAELLLPKKLQHILSRFAKRVVVNTNNLSLSNESKVLSFCIDLETTFEIIDNQLFCNLRYLDLSESDNRIFEWILSNLYNRKQVQS